MINISEINIQKWNAMLQEVNPQKDVVSDKVICRVKKDGEQFYEVLDKSDWEDIDAKSNSTYFKLRLSDIVSISNRLIAEKSMAPVSLNPLLPIFMPIEGWKKKYHIGLLVRIPDLLNSKNLVSAAGIMTDFDGLKVSQPIVEELLEIEKENHQLREIFTYLNVMSEKADQNRLKRVHTIWQKFNYWICILIYGSRTSNIKQKLELELGEPDQALDMAEKLLQGMIFQVANEFLKDDGLPQLPKDQINNVFPNGAACRIWIAGKPLQYGVITRLSNVWDNVANAKKSVDLEEEFI